MYVYNITTVLYLVNGIINDFNYICEKKNYAFVAFCLREHMNFYVCFVFWMI